MKKLKWSDMLKVYAFVHAHWGVVKAEMEAIEQYKGAKTGAEKKAAIMQFCENLYRAVDEDSSTVTPAMVEVALFVTSGMVDAIVALWNAIGKFQK